jgi:hypothetical protein
MMSAPPVSARYESRDPGSNPCATSATGRTLMRHFLPKICVGAAALAAGAANANEQLVKMSQNSKEWVMPTREPSLFAAQSDHL